MSEDLRKVAVRAAHAGAEVLRRYYRDATLEIHCKGDNDFATRADHESEERILGVIRESFPDHHFLAEESGADATSPQGEYEWIIDPLDGTSNFMQGLPYWSVSIACRRRDGEVLAGVVYDPLGENLFTAARGEGALWNDRPMCVSERPGLASSFLATGYPFRSRAALDVYLEVFRDVFFRSRGIRRCGSAALDLAYTAAGVFDGFFEFRLSPWDIAAGVLLIQESGGRVTDLDGGPGFFRAGNIIAGPEAVHRELLAAISAHVTEKTLSDVMARGLAEAGATAEADADAEAGMDWSASPGTASTGNQSVVEVVNEMA